MRMLIVLLATMFLHGCIATSYVIEKAKGHHRFFANNIEGAHIDNVQNEFALCIADSSDAKEEGSSRFTVRIPKDLVAKGGDDRFSLMSKSVREVVKERDWFGFEYEQPVDRKTIKSYELSHRFLAITAVDGCGGDLSHLEYIEILRVPKNIGVDEAVLFKGDTINGMLAKKKPFVVFSPEHLLPKRFVPELSPCESQDHSCLMLVTKPQSEGVAKSSSGDQTFIFSELLSINELTRAVRPKPQWYLLMPFSIALDAVIDGASVGMLLLLLGAAGPAGA